MQPLTDPADLVDLPLSLRIMPSRCALRAAFAASIASIAIASWLVRDPDGPLPHPILWIVLGLSTLTGIGSGLRLLLQLPVLEASELGIAVWLYGPYRAPFFAPWSRVRAITLTRVRRASTTVAARDALGIELDRDDRFRLPGSLAKGESPVDGAPPADLVWSSRSISGDLRRWVELLQTMKKVYEAPLT